MLAAITKHFLFIYPAVLIAAFPSLAFSQWRFVETGGTKTEYVGFQPPAAITTNLLWTIPAADGGANQCLATNGSGTLQWLTPAGVPGGANTQIQFNSSGAFAGNANLIWDNTNSRLGIGTTSPAAKLEVAGEVRTVNSSGTARVYGTGRPGVLRYGTTGAETGLCTNGGVTFGLSNIAVSWEGVAHACAAGTWVCTNSERGTGACNTARPDGTIDAVSNAGGGLNWTAAAHWGWVSDVGTGTISGISVGEAASSSGSDPTGTSMPVWCCN